MMLLCQLIAPTLTSARGVRSWGAGGISCIPVKGKEVPSPLQKSPVSKIWAKGAPEGGEQTLYKASPAGCRAL